MDAIADAPPPQCIGLTPMELMETLTQPARDLLDSAQQEIERQLQVEVAQMVAPLSKLADYVPGLGGFLPSLRRRKSRPFPADLVDYAVKAGYSAEAAASCSWRLAAAYGGKPEELTIESCGDLLLQALREESNAPGLQFIQSAATGRAASRQSVRRRLSDAGESVSDVDNVSTLNERDFQRRLKRLRDDRIEAARGRKGLLWWLPWRRWKQEGDAATSLRPIRVPRGAPADRDRGTGSAENTPTSRGDRGSGDGRGMLSPGGASARDPGARQGGANSPNTPRSELPSPPPVRAQRGAQRGYPETPVSARSDWRQRLEDVMFSDDGHDDGYDDDGYYSDGGESVGGLSLRSFRSFRSFRSLRRGRWGNLFGGRGRGGAPQGPLPLPRRNRAGSLLAPFILGSGLAAALVLHSVQLSTDFIEAVAGRTPDAYGGVFDSTSPAAQGAKPELFYSALAGRSVASKVLVDVGADPNEARWVSLGFGFSAEVTPIGAVSARGLARVSSLLVTVPGIDIERGITVRSFGVPVVKVSPLALAVAADSDVIAESLLQGGARLDLCIRVVKTWGECLLIFGAGVHGDRGATNQAGRVLLIWERDHPRPAPAPGAGSGGFFSRLIGGGEGSSSEGGRGKRSRSRPARDTGREARGSGGQEGYGARGGGSGGAERGGDSAGRNSRWEDGDDGAGDGDEGDDDAFEEEERAAAAAAAAAAARRRRRAATPAADGGGGTKNGGASSSSTRRAEERRKKARERLIAELDLDKYDI